MVSYIYSCVIIEKVNKTKPKLYTTGKQKIKHCIYLSSLFFIFIIIIIYIY